MLFIKKIEGRRDIFMVTLNDIEVGVVKNREDFIKVLTPLIGQKNLSQKDFERYIYKFEGTLDFIKNHPLSRFCAGAGIFPDEIKNATTELEAATEKSYREMDEAAHKNAIYARSNKIFPSIN